MDIMLAPRDMKRLFGSWARLHISIVHYTSLHNNMQEIWGQAKGLTIFKNEYAY